MASPTPLPLTTIFPSCQSSSPETFTFDQDLATDMLLKCIIQTNLSIHSFSSDRFTRFVQENLQPEYQKVSETTFKRLALKHYLQAKRSLIDYFQNYQSKVSLTIHAWKTSGHHIPYTCIICHWIDPHTWKMSKRIIALEQFEEVYGVIMSSVSEYKLKDKVMSISIDDFGGYYTPVMEKLKMELNPMFNGAFFHTKCACQFINSMVQSIFDHAALLIKKFQDLFYYVFRSYDETEKFKLFLSSKRKKFIDIVGFLPYDWNSIQITFGHMLKQKSLIVEFYTGCGNSDIENNDWENIESLLGILKVFRTSIIRLSDAHCPTIPLVLGEILIISHMFKEYKNNPFWKPCILEMQSKVLKYYETMPPIFTCAAALNPKIGLNGVQNILEDIEENLGVDNNNNNNLKNDYAKVSMTKCNDVLHEVYDYYDKMHRSRRQERDMIMESGSRNLIMESVLRKKTRNMMISNELELYKQTDFLKVMSYDEYDKCKMLEYWRDKGRYQYPIMGEMVRDMLTVQASTMALEFAFCLHGRALDDLTTWKLRPRWLEMSMFLKEHFDDNEGKEDVVIVIDDDDDDDGSEDADDDDDFLIARIKEELFDNEWLRF